MPMLARVHITAALAVLLALPACEKKADPSGAVATAAESAPPAASDAAEAPHEAPASGPNAGDAYLALAAVMDKAPRDANGDWTDAAIAQHAADIARVVEASRLPRCDFGTDYSQGLATMMPHLGKVRGVARALRGDARLHLVAGHPDKAAQSVGALFRLSAHVARPGRAIIEQMVAMAVADLGAKFVAEHPELAKAASKGEIIEGIAGVRRDLIDGAKVALAHERDMVVSALRSHDQVQLLAQYLPKLGNASKAEREAAAKRVEALCADAIAAWDAPDAVARLKGLVERAQSEGVAEVFVGWDKLRASMDRLKEACDKAGATVK